MDVDMAIMYINSLVYFPGWKITATDHTRRFEGHVKVRIEYPAVNTDRDNAMEGYRNCINTYGEFAFAVIDCENPVTLYRRVLDKILAIYEHEAREGLRTMPAFEAPFHPHRLAGIQNWGGNPDSDIQFGVA